MNRLRQAAVIAVAGLAAIAPAKQARADCPQDLNELSTVLETPRPRGPLNAAVEQLRSLRDAARRLQDSGDAAGCARVAQQGLAIWRRAAAIDLAPVDSVTGLRVDDSQGQKVGSIRNLIVDIASGQIVFAVVRTGGFLGIGAENYAVPWKAISHKPGAESVTLAIPRQRLQAAPRFDREAWGDTASGDWAASVFSFFGVEPYWETTTRAASDARQTELQAVAARLDAIAKTIQDLQNAAAQRRESDQDALKQLGARIDAMSSRIDRIEAAPAANGAAAPPQAATPAPPESSSGTATPAPNAAPPAQ